MKSLFKFLTSLNHMPIEYLNAVIALSAIMLAGFSIYAVLVIAG